MGYVPPPPPAEWIEVTCLGDAERRFIPYGPSGEGERTEPFDVSVLDERWRIERNDRLQRETIRQNNIGTLILLSLLLTVIGCVI